MKADEEAGAAATLALRRTAMLCAALMLVVVTASAFLRHHGGTPALQAAWANELAAARMAHRIAATLMLLGAVALLWLARRAREGAAAHQATALLGVALLLSAVGVAGGASRAAPVVLVNLLGGFAMLALCVRLAAGTARNGSGRAAVWLLALVVLQAAGGAVASTQALAQCGLLTECSAFAVLHRASGVLLALVLIAWGARTAWRDQRWEGAAMALIAWMLLMVGLLAAGLGSLSIPALVVVHNVLAATALAVLVWRA